MRIEPEAVMAKDLQPGDMFVDAGWKDRSAKDGYVTINMRTEGPLHIYRDEEPVSRLKIERRRWTHGLRSTYIAGCRCTSCTAAQRVYMRSYSRSRRETEVPV